MYYRPDISTIYRSKTDISIIYRRYCRLFTDFSLKRLSIVDIVSNITDIRYINDISAKISDIFIPGFEREVFDAVGVVRVTKV